MPEEFSEAPQEEEADLLPAEEPAEEEAAEEAPPDEAFAEWERQEQALLTDPDWGEAYSLLREETLSLLEACREAGSVEIPVRAAFCALLEENAGILFRALRQSAEENAVRRLTETARATPGRLSGGEPAQSPDYAALSQEEFEQRIRLAKNGALRSC